MKFYFQKKSDDEDSGNDEPVDLPLDYNYFSFNGQNPQLLSPDFERPKRAEPPRLAVPSSKIDRLADQLSLLSTPRLSDSITSIVYNLPPESKYRCF